MPLLRALDDDLSRPGRQSAVEGLRGVLVTVVVGYHLLRLLLTLSGGNWGDTAPRWLWWTATGRFGVDAFFVLAGLFVSASWEGLRRGAADRWAAIRAFARRRVLRILPPFWAAVGILGSLAVASGRIDLRDLALLASTQHYVDQAVPASVDLPMWSLTTEVQFYVLAPVVVVLARRMHGVPLLALTLATSTWWAWWPGRGDLAAGLLPGRLDQFVVGIVAAGLLRRFAGGERPVVVRLMTTRGAGGVLLAALVTLGTFHGATFQRGEDGWLEHAVHPIAGLLIGGLVLRVLCGRSVPALELRWWRFLGLISFSLYLWHYPILDHGLGWAGLRGSDAVPAITTVLVAAGLLGVVLAVSTLSWWLFEHRVARAWRPTEVRGQAELVTATSAV